MSKTKTWTAETIAVGSELLLGGRLDTNSLFIADRQGAEPGVGMKRQSASGKQNRPLVAGFHGRQNHFYRFQRAANVGQEVF